MQKPACERMKIDFARGAMAGLAGLLAVAVQAGTATKLKDFEGIEEPVVKYTVATDKFEHDDFVNITDVGDNTVRMTLRYSPEWWDGDRGNSDKSRQRAEVKGIGPHQKNGDTFEYATTWRTNPEFHGSNKFCHVFQLKATNGDDGAPLVVLSVLKGTKAVAVRYWSGNEKEFTVVREFGWKPGEWQTVRIRIKTSTAKDGSVMVSVNGDEFQGATGVAIYRPDATDYRPKWGLYRGTTPELPKGVSWVEHREASATKR
jgi:polysaccharide lyase-like protein